MHLGASYSTMICYIFFLLCVTKEVFVYKETHVIEINTLLTRNRDFCQNSANIAIIPRNHDKNREFRRYFCDLWTRLMMRSYRDLLDDYFWPVEIHKKHRKIHAMIDLFLQNGQHIDLFSLLHLLIICFPVFRPDFCVSNFLGSPTMGELD